MVDEMRACASESWIEVYRQLMRIDGVMYRQLDGMSSADAAGAAHDQRLIAAEYRRLRARFRFWAETMGTELGTDVPGA